jgi:hypothetical protein
MGIALDPPDLALFHPDLDGAAHGAHEAQTVNFLSHDHLPFLARESNDYPCGSLCLNLIIDAYRAYLSPILTPGPWSPEKETSIARIARSALPWQPLGNYLKIS